MKNQANIVIEKGCHSRKSVSGIYNACRCQTKENTLLNGCVEDPRLEPALRPCGTGSSGMTPNFKEEALNKGAFRAPLRSGFTLRPSSSRSVSMRDIGAAPRGFTLIELLVIVLIIGILAAVTLPQYQKAVEKSRLAEPLSYGNTFQKAVSVYLLENNLPAGEERIKFIGNATGEQTLKLSLPLDIEASLDCTSMADKCVGKYFAYDGYCTATDCLFRAARYFNSDFSDATTANSSYYLSWRFRKNTWNTACVFTTELGASICNNLRQQGWKATNGRP